MPANADRRSGVSFDQVIAAAMEMADREGPSGLTMRRLASELGIGVMTLYGHIRTKEELLDYVVDMVVAGLEIPTEGTWDEQLFQLFVNLRELLHRHPTVLHADPLRPMTGPASLRAADAALGMLRAGGIDGADAIDGMSALISYTFGAAMFRLEHEGDARRHYELNVRGADPDTLPNVAALSGFFLERGSEREFEVGLRILIDGLARRT